jgi:hypothetical protein
MHVVNTTEFPTYMHNFFLFCFDPFRDSVFVFNMAAEQSSHAMSVTNEYKVAVTRISCSERWQSFEEREEDLKIRTLRCWPFCSV